MKRLFVVKAIITASVMFGFFVSMIAIWLIILNSHLRSRVIARIASFFCGSCLYFLGVKLSLTGEEYDENKNYFIVANHVSYLDALCISSVMPSLFVTSVEIAGSGGLGWLCRLGRCIFVERRSIWNLKSEVAEIERSLVEGFNVVVFPESTTTDGSSMLPFKSSLLQAAVNASVDVLPICINYRKVNGEKTSIYTRDSVFWYGDMTFMPHLTELIKLRSIQVELNVLDPISSDSEMNRKRITAAAHNRIEQNFAAVVV